MKNRLCLCVLFLVLLVSVPFSFGQSSEAESLQGLQAVNVLVESLGSEERRTGLTAEQIKTDVELQLRKVGIRIDESVFQYLYVDVSILQPEAVDIFVYSLFVTLFQPVTLRRDSSISTTGATWGQREFGVVGKDRVRNGIRESMRDLVDKFLNDYLTVNPVTR